MIKLPGKDGPGMVSRFSGGAGSVSSVYGSVPSSDFALLQEGERRLASVEAQARARVDLQSVFDRVEREVATAPEAADAKALGDLYTDTVRTVRDETVKTIPNAEDQDTFMRRFGDHAMRRLGPLTDRLNSARKTQATARLEQTLTNIAGALTLEEDGEEMDRLVQDGLGAIDGFAGSLPAEDRAALKKGFHHKLAEAEFTKLLQDDPAEAREAIKRGAFSDMDQTLQDQWKRRAHHAAAARGRDAPRTEAAARRAEAEARTKEQLAAYTDLTQRIDEGEAGFAEIDAAFADGGGVLSVDQNRRLVAQVEAKAEKNRQVADATDRIGALIAEGTSLTEEHDSDLGLVFDETIGKCHPDMTADQGRMVLMFAEQTRRIPGPCLEPIWRCFENGPASKAGPCAGFLHRIGSIEGLELPVPEHLRPTFDGFQQMIDAGWSLTEALEKQREEPGIPGLQTMEYRGDGPAGELRNTIARAGTNSGVIMNRSENGRDTQPIADANSGTSNAPPDAVGGFASSKTNEVPTETPVSDHNTDKGLSTPDEPAVGDEKHATHDPQSHAEQLALQKRLEEIDAQLESLEGVPAGRDSDLKFMELEDEREVLTGKLEELKPEPLNPPDDIIVSDEQDAIAFRDFLEGVKDRIENGGNLLGPERESLEAQIDSYANGNMWLSRELLTGVLGERDKTKALAALDRTKDYWATPEMAARLRENGKALEVITTSGGSVENGNLDIRKARDAVFESAHELGVTIGAVEKGRAAQDIASALPEDQRGPFHQVEELSKAQASFQSRVEELTEDVRAKAQALADTTILPHPEIDPDLESRTDMLEAMPGDMPEVIVTLGKAGIKGAGKVFKPVAIAATTVSIVIDTAVEGGAAPVAAAELYREKMNEGFEKAFEEAGIDPENGEAVVAYMRDNPKLGETILRDAAHASLIETGAGEIGGKLGGSLSKSLGLDDVGKALFDETMSSIGGKIGRELDK